MFPSHLIKSCMKKNLISHSRTINVSFGNNSNSFTAPNFATNFIGSISCETSNVPNGATNLCSRSSCLLSHQTPNNIRVAVHQPYFNHRQQCHSLVSYQLFCQYRSVFGKTDMTADSHKVVRWIRKSYSEHLSGGSFP